VTEFGPPWSDLIGFKVRSELKKAAGVKIDFEHLVLDFFPHPHVIMNRVILAMPPGVKRKAATVTVQPEILPLLLGKIQLANLHLDSAELDYILPQQSELGLVRGRTKLTGWN
jgi:uncharacterized protein involved in outer membrane biogenesis